MYRIVKLVNTSLRKLETIRIECNYTTINSYVSENVSYYMLMRTFYHAEFEDTKGVFRIRISTKNRQHNDKNEKDKRTNNDLQNIHIKLKIE